jgi:hypothetical protein
MRAPSKSHRTPASWLAWLGMSCLWISGCAVKPDPHAKSSEPGPGTMVTFPVSSSLDAIGSSLKSREDSLVLELMKGYRALRLSATPEVASSADVLNGRQAYDALERILREGGLKGNSGGAERLFSLGDKSQLTLQEALTVANKSAQKLVLDGDLEKAKQRNRDIVLNRPTLSFAVEDAQWALALLDALSEPGLPEPTKKKLRTLHEVYYQEAPQDEVVRQVNGLLAEIPDEKFRQHLKKLANRAWERDRRANRLPQGAKKASIQDTASAFKSDVSLPESSSSVVAAPAKPPVLANAAPPVSDSVKPADTVGTSGTEFQIDSLIAAGQYVLALRALEGIDPQTRSGFIKDRRSKAGERFCDERRKNAADLYKKARTANNDGMKEKLLRTTQAELDSCLFYFPETSVSAKVRRNRDMVDAELKKLKK